MLARRPSSHRAHDDQLRRSESALASLPGDVAWELRGVLKYGGCAMVAGCASSFIGIGGGIVIVRPSRQIHAEGCGAKLLE